MKNLTLVEVFVIIGIIATVFAVTAPQYRNYQAKARQAEIKIVLAESYVALTNFAAEHGTYSSCLAKLGANVNVDSGMSLYTFGFDSKAASAVLCGPGASKWPCTTLSYDLDGNARRGIRNTKWKTVEESDCASRLGLGETHFVGRRQLRGNEPVAIEQIPGGFVSSYQFRLLGAGRIVPSAGDRLDVWEINSSKQLTHVSSGLE